MVVNTFGISYPKSGTEESQLNFNCNEQFTAHYLCTRWYATWHDKGLSRVSLSTPNVSTVVLWTPNVSTVVVVSYLGLAYPKSGTKECQLRFNCNDQFTAQRFRSGWYATWHDRGLCRVTKPSTPNVSIVVKSPRLSNPKSGTLCRPQETFFQTCYQTGSQQKPQRAKARSVYNSFRKWSLLIFGVVLAYKTAVATNADVVSVARDPTLRPQRLASEWHVRRPVLNWG